MLSRIPDPTVFHSGSKFFLSRIPDPRQIIKYFNPKNLFLSSRKYDSDCSYQIRIVFFIHPGSRGQKGTRFRSRIRLRNTAHKFSFLIISYVFVYKQNVNPIFIISYVFVYKQNVNPIFEIWGLIEGNNYRTFLCWTWWRR